MKILKLLITWVLLFIFSLFIFFTLSSPFILLKIILILAITIVLLIFQFQSIKNIINKFEPEIKAASSIILFLTILSIAVGITTSLNGIQTQKESLEASIKIQQENWQREDRIKEENNSIYLENAKKELEGNIVKLNYITQNMEEFKTTPSIPVNRFKFSYLEKLSNIYSEKEVREEIIVTIDAMDTINHLLDRIETSPTLEFKQGLLNDILKFFENLTTEKLNLLDEKLKKLE